MTPEYLTKKEELLEALLNFKKERKEKGILTSVDDVCNYLLDHYTIYNDRMPYSIFYPLTTETLSDFFYAEYAEYNEDDDSYSPECPSLGALLEKTHQYMMASLDDCFKEDAVSAIQDLVDDH